MADNLVYEKFDKNIYVYKNLITEPQNLVSILKDSEKDPSSSFIFKDWGKWGSFGSYMNAGSVAENDPDLINNERYQKEKFYKNEILDAFEIATGHFLKEHGIKIEDYWTKMGPSYCRYDQDVIMHPEDVAGPLTMTYHTDYQWAEFDSSKPKFALTCTMYLNDDYAGGDVVFKLMKNEERKTYVPIAGDVVVFPSGHPKLLSEDGVYFHGVTEIKNSDKYFIRYFYLLPGEPSEDWLELEQKYGSKEWNDLYEKTIVQDRLEKGLNNDNRKLK